MLTTAAVLGNVCGYEIGRAIGPPLYNRDGRILKRKYFDETTAFFDKHGNKALVIGRFVPFVRTYITVVAGVTRMDRRRFFFWSLVGAAIWVTSITTLGYFLGNVPKVGPFLSENIDYAILVILLFTVIPIGYEAIKRRRQHHGDAARTRDPGADRCCPRSQPRAAVELRLGEHRAHLEPDVGERVLVRRAPVDRADDDLDDRARLAQRVRRVAYGAAGGDDVLDQRDPATGDVRALGELAGAVLLGLLAHEQRRACRSGC